MRQVDRARRVAAGRVALKGSQAHPQVSGDVPGWLDLVGK